MGPAIQSDLQLSNFSLGLLFSAFMIGYMLLCPVFGILGDRVIRTKLMSLSVLAWSLATLLGGFTRSFIPLFITRLFVGVGEAGFSTVVPAYLKDFSDSEKTTNKHLSFFYLAMPIGAALGFALGGYIAKEHSWQSGLIVASVPGFLLAWFIHRLPRSANQKQVESKGNLFKIAKELFSIRDYRLSVSAYTAYTFTLGGLATWGPKFGTAVFGLPLDQVSLGVGVVTLVSAVIGTLIGAKFGTIFVENNDAVQGLSKFSGMMSIVAFIFCMLSIWMSDFYWFLGFLFLGEVFLFALTAPINTAILTSAPTQYAASCIAISTLCIHAFGDFISPPLVGLLADYFSFQISMSVLPMMLLVASYIWLRLSVQDK